MKKKETLVCYLLNFLSFAGISMVNTQIVPFLKNAGFSVVDRGLLLSGSAFVAVLGQIMAGYICDHIQKLRPVYIISYVLLTLGSILLFLFPEKSFFLYLLAVGLSGGMVRVIMGLNETWMLQIDQNNYGRLRASGALGLAVFSTVAGFLIKPFGYQALLFVYLCIALGVFFLVYRIKDINKQKKKVNGKDIKELLINKKYMLLVCIFLLIYMIGTADQYVVVDKMLQIGGNNTQVGWKWAVQSFMEVPLFLMAEKILKKWKPEFLLKAGIVFYAIKFFLYAFVQKPMYLIFVSSLQLVTLPLIMLSSKFLFQSVTKKELFNTAQMFAMAIFVGGSMFFTPIITSYLSKILGYNMLLYGIAMFTIIPFILSILYTRMKNKC